MRHGPPPADIRRQPAGPPYVVIWELSGTGEDRQRRGLHLIGYAFAALAVYLLVQSTLVLAGGCHPRHSPLGIAWTAVAAVAAVAMFVLAAGPTAVVALVIALLLAIALGLIELIGRLQGSGGPASRELAACRLAGADDGSVSRARRRAGGVTHVPVSAFLAW